MKNHIDILKVTRKNLLKSIDGLSDEQLNKIPDGFNNNIIWNLGHVLVTQQLLCYRLGGVDTMVTDDIINKYRKGTKPETVIETDEIEMIKKSLVDIANCLDRDIERNIFKNYKVYPTSYGLTLNNFGEALVFNNIHEGMHYGTILSLKKLV